MLYFSAQSMVILAPAHKRFTQVSMTRDPDVELNRTISITTKWNIRSHLQRYLACTNTLWNCLMTLAVLTKLPLVLINNYIHEYVLNVYVIQYYKYNYLKLRIEQRR